MLSHLSKIRFILNSILNVFKVWLDECTYTLTPVEDLASSENDEIPKRVLTCQIIEVNDDNYIQVSSADGDKRKLTSQLNFVN